jgi:hypothetical protein
VRIPRICLLIWAAIEVAALLAARLLILVSIATAMRLAAQEINIPKPVAGHITGTVTDVNGDTVPGATVVLEGSALEYPRTVAANDNGFFDINQLACGTYRVTISAPGFANWTSPEIILDEGRYLILKGARLNIAEALTTITVASSAASREELSHQQVKILEQQHVLGFIPNFYVSYDQNAAPLTSKSKFQLAAKIMYNPVTFIGVGIDAAAQQAGDHMDYPQGWKGFGQRYGAIYANGLTDIMIGGAILPSLLHQDPRYFYRGTGTTKSRILHALSSPFVCKGDNGRSQPNYSTIGGDLASAAISNTYYPESNRGVGFVFGNFLLGTGQRVAADLAQEFILSRLTHKARN